VLRRRAIVEQEAGTAATAAANVIVV